MPSNKYTDLIAGAHTERERYVSWVYALTEPLVAAKNRLAQMVLDFDVDYAEGAQLDALAVRIGLSRKIQEPIKDVFFAFDDVDGIGFDFGAWKEAKDDAYSITTLGDEVFRRLLKAKIALNQYSGKNEDSEATLALVANAFDLNSSLFGYLDNQDLSITISLARDKVPPIVWDVFNDGIFSVNQAGISQNVIDGITGALATTSSEVMTSDEGDVYIMDFK